MLERIYSYYSKNKLSRRDDDSYIYFYFHYVEEPEKSGSFCLRSGRPSSGKILYESDEEGNILCKEGESYCEQRGADAPITID